MVDINVVFWGVGEGEERENRQTMKSAMKW